MNGCVGESGFVQPGFEGGGRDLKVACAALMLVQGRKGEPVREDDGTMRAYVQEVSEGEIFRVGDRVEVEGVLRSDGTVLADDLKREDGDDDDDDDH